MKTRVTKLIFLLLSFFTTSFFYGQDIDEQGFNCFSIMAGKDATSDGSVMFAHNEDDYGKRVVNWYRVPFDYPGEDAGSIVLRRGGKIKQAKETCRYFWFELPELEFSDSYFNEYGIVIASDGCNSREDSADITDGGIGYWLRRVMAERARTAKEAVKIGGALIEQMGYASSGRTYCIAGPDEAWMLSVVKGKHWVAERIPDNQVAIVPNYFTITTVDLSDTVNFLGSPDLIEYAVKRGWYDPEKDGAFNFKKAYAVPGSLDSRSNIARHWVTLNALSGKQYDFNGEFPFSFVPKKKIELKDLFKALRNHYEGTQYDITDNYTKGNPHKQDFMTVCSNSNQYGFVAQLRNNMPVDIGAVLWIAPRRPCIEPFIPLYSGLLVIPKGFAVTDYKTALKNHFNKIKDFDAYSKGHIWNDFDHKAMITDSDYGKYLPLIKKEVYEMEDGLLSKQSGFEENILEIYSREPEQAKEMLSEYILSQIEKMKNIKY